MDLASWSTIVEFHCYLCINPVCALVYTTNYCMRCVLDCTHKHTVLISETSTPTVLWIRNRNPGVPFRESCLLYFSAFRRCASSALTSSSVATSRFSSSCLDVAAFSIEAEARLTLGECLRLAGFVFLKGLCNLLRAT